MKKTPRTTFALSAKTRRTKIRKHKNTPKGGSKNIQVELLSELDGPRAHYMFKCNECYFVFNAIYETNEGNLPGLGIACPECTSKNIKRA
jgi:hypothetical protein